MLWSVFFKVCLGVSLGNNMQMVSCFGHAQMWLWWAYRAHVVFCANSWNSTNRCLHWFERHRHFVQSTYMGDHESFWLESSSHDRKGAPLFPKRPWSSTFDYKTTELVHANNFAYDMHNNMPCANSYGSSNSIRLFHILVVRFCLYCFFGFISVVTNRTFDHLMT